MEQNVDKKIAAYIENNHKATIESNVKKIASGSYKDLFAALTFMNAEPNLDLNEEQLFRILKPLRKEIVDEAIKENLGAFVMNIKSPVIDDYFKDKLDHEKTDIQLLYMAVVHFTLYEYKGDLSLFEKAMDNINPKDRAPFYGGLLQNCRASNQTWILPILNSKKLVVAMETGFNNEVKMKFYRDGFARQTDLKREDYNDTYFYTKK